MKCKCGRYTPGIVCNKCLDRLVSYHTIELLELAFSQELSQVERSNNFDTWRTKLQDLAKDAAEYSFEQQALLTCILQGIGKTDLVDFATDQIPVLVRANRMLFLKDFTVQSVEELQDAFSRAGLPLKHPPEKQEEKRCLFDANEKYTQSALDIESAAINAITLILEEAVAKGFKVRDVALIFHCAVSSVTQEKLT